MGRRKPYGSIPRVHGLLPWFIRRESRIVVVDYYRSATPIGMVPMLQAMFADRGDAGPIMRALAETPLQQLNNKNIHRGAAAKGFEAVPMRWIVERTIAWLNRCRRSAKTRDTISRNTLALLKLASIRLMPRNIFQCLNKLSGRTRNPIPDDRVPRKARNRRRAKLKTAGEQDNVRKPTCCPIPPTTG
jgi:hypothetical protein